MIDEIEVQGKHSQAQIDGELSAMLGKGHGAGLTLGVLLDLYLAGSPYAVGGDVTSRDVAFAVSLMGAEGEMTAQEAHRMVSDALDEVWRVFEILRPGERRSGGKESETPIFSPEWVADTVAMAAKALPSLTWDEAVHRTPLVRLVHLGMSAARASGAVTERPKDFGAAFRELRARIKEEEKDG